MFPIPLKSLSTDQERHDYILKTFIYKNKCTADQRKHKRDIDIIRENHRFLWNDHHNEDSWEIRLAKRYYDKLFKEYCIADLTRYKENKIALRWRTESEVIAGIGQFQCGSRKCTETNGLRSWEVNFSYKEQDEQKNALIKLRLCPEHSDQLNYTSKKREIKRLKRSDRQIAKYEKQNNRKSSSAQRKQGFNDSSSTANANDNIGNLNNVPDAKCNQVCLEGEEAEETNKSEDENLEESEEIWNRKINIEEPETRESEFERYLEDLLL